jgi:ATP-binding cassette, subfamily F, member 3
MSVGYLKQETEEVAGDRSVLDEALLAFEPILKLESEEQRLLQAMDEHPDHTEDAYTRLMEAFNVTHEKLIASEVHLIKPRTEAVLTGLGFAADDLERPLSTFSGGWRMRVALARLLLTQPDVLLLDEPTNHLDIDSIDWLEAYLKAYPGTVVLVSHDRYFLDRMVQTTVELIQGQMTEYAGNYSFYLEDRIIRREHHASAYLNQQKLIADNEKFIERFRYKNTKATQVQSRVKMLDRLERIPPPPSDEATISFRFPEPPRSGRTVMDISKFTKVYSSENGPIKVFEDTPPIQIERGDKIALIGKNGAGKSTLARMLLGTEPFDGTRKEGHNVEMTFFAQHQAETLERGQSALDALRSVAVGRSETELRTLLGAFLFRGDDAFKTISVLSGGERSRVALARTLASPANLLILDEPTNHLDIQSIGVLTEALRQYTGTFVLVSHDRHFLDRVVNKVWRVEEGHVEEYEGNFSEYLWQAEHGTRSTTSKAPAVTAAPTPPPTVAPPSAEPTSGPKSKEQKRREAQEREKLRKQKIAASGSRAAGLNSYQLKKEYAKTESEVETMETKKAELEAQLADPATFSDPAKGKALMAEFERLQTNLTEKNKDWEDLASEMSARDLD